jgi:hypothetical protein
MVGDDECLGSGSCRERRIFGVKDALHDQLARPETANPLDVLPAQRAVDVASSCKCGDALAICSALCPDETAPKRYINIDAKAHFAGFVLDRSISAGETIRVR